MSGRRRKTLRNRQIASGLLIATAVVCQGMVSAQEITIQQPVVSHFSVDTTASVPDRGGIYLGGVGRAGSSRKSFGFSRPGTSTGTFSEGSSVSAHVWIHDLDAMDKAVLNATDTNSLNSYQVRNGAISRLRPEVSHAAEYLRSRHLKKSTPRLKDGVTSRTASVEPFSARSRGLRMANSQFSAANSPRKLSVSSDKRVKR